MAGITKPLYKILDSVDTLEIKGATDVPVTGLSYHSQHVRSGFIFFCLKGRKDDGHDYINEAISSGAAAVVVEDDRYFEGATKIKVPSVREAVAVMSQNFYDYPSRKIRLVGVTGTNGKTTTTHLIEAILTADLRSTGLIGTIQYKIGEETFSVAATTPEAPDLQSLLYTMVERGVQYAVMEVSSHALEWHRVLGCEFDVAVLTNVTEDHLDFHETFERYRAAKGKLFSQLGSSKQAESCRYAVLNKDDPNYKYFLGQSAVDVVTYGVKNSADISAQNIEVKGEGVSFELLSPLGKVNIEMKLTGVFSVYNALAAAAVAYKEGIDSLTVKEVLENVKGIPGRFEKVDVGQEFFVIVDYAHTPDGLENVLQAAKSLGEGKIITIFGCGGERDKDKRPIMGRIAGSYSDYCILTSDNPRGEDPWQIIQGVEQGLKEKMSYGHGYVVQADRYEAIKLGIDLARPKDIIIIAGKGHETYQVFSDYTVPFDDREVARKIIKQRVTN